MVILGLDYGLKFTGIAIAFGPLAEPIQTVPTSQLLTNLRPLIDRHAPDRIIIGLSENQMATRTKEFGDQLHQATGLPVYYQDETLTSQETRVSAARSGKAKRDRQAKLDHLAAAAILQDYLDTLP